MRYVLMLSALLLAGCHTPDFDPSRARGAYPYELHSTDTIPVEVFRDGTDITVVNSTARSWQAATMWINQRFSASMPSLRAGQSITMSLNNFYDDLGVTYPAGGLFATRRRMPVRLVEIQMQDEAPLIGLIAIRQTDSQ